MFKSNNMDRYTFIFNDSTDFKTIDNNNPFIGSKFDDKDFLTFCKNYYTYINLSPEILFDTSNIVIKLDNINIMYKTVEDFTNIFNTRLQSCKKKTPFFILRGEVDNDIKTEFCNLNNTLFVKNEDPIEYIIQYFSKRLPEENIVYHVIALCYNESRLLPHFLNHYKTADKIIIYDNKSTDNSVEIMTKYNVSEIKSFDSCDGFNDSLHSNKKNNSWQESKNIADFVIVQDMDEFVHFPESPYSIKKGLLQLKNKNTAYVVCKGYDMCCTDDEFKNTPCNESIFDYIKKGYYNECYSKPNIINPNVIGQTNWTVGNHAINPSPYSKPTEHNVLILHYKHMGIDWEFKRRLVLRDKLNLCYHGFGTEYLMSDMDTLEYIKNIHTKAKNIGHIIKNKILTSSVIEYYKTKGLSGRLGNQLFNIFTTLSVGFEYNFETFFICSKTIEQDYRNNLFRNLNIIDDYNINNFSKVIETDQNIFTNFENIKEQNKVMLQGYFQSSKYFNKYKRQILNIITPLPNEQEYIDDFVKNIRLLFPNKKLVGVHFRRGDYISLNWLLPLQYYEKAIEYYDESDHVFVLFSDDKEWCKTYYPKFFVCEIEDGYDDYIEMFIMSKMDSIIISNSTFSWWAAYIGNPKTVICPYPWFRNASYNPAIYEKEWIQLKYEN